MKVNHEPNYLEAEQVYPLHLFIFYDLIEM